MITHNQLMRYLTLQYIGYVNMNDLQRVHKLTGLSIDDIKYIQTNYKALTQEELPIDNDINDDNIVKEIISAIPIDDYPIEL